MWNGRKPDPSGSCRVRIKRQGSVERGADKCGEKRSHFDEYDGGFRVIWISVNFCILFVLRFGVRLLNHISAVPESPKTVRFSGGKDVLSKFSLLAT
ncbi:hypothetical protein TNCT_76221 [Trichonephila clavata]|uniref:Uncharacterized protein n=1 Tax=Trichonephila clavata TaxID=2740835 RepID=A0A8X6KT95_TRICU|nr:hypothetical protein TNCT_76221 [Trichonephila clavata]